MSQVTTLIAIGSFVLSTAAGCAEPGVTHVEPVMGGAGGMSAPKPPTPAPGGAGSTSPAPSPAGTGSAMSPVMMAGAPAAGAPAAGSPAAGSPAAGSPAAGSPATAGSSATAGAMATAGASGGAAGAPGSAAPGPCPSGFMCTDLGVLGFAATDGHGNAVKASCGNGAPIDCNEADPKASCAGLTNPICAHVDIGGSEIVSCGQICTP